MLQTMFNQENGSFVIMCYGIMLLRLPAIWGNFLGGILIAYVVTDLLCSLKEAQAYITALEREHFKGANDERL